MMVGFVNKVVTSAFLLIAFGGCSAIQKHSFERRITTCDRLNFLSTQIQNNDLLTTIVDSCIYYFSRTHPTVGNPFPQKQYRRANLRYIFLKTDSLNRIAICDEFAVLDEFDILDSVGKGILKTSRLECYCKINGIYVFMTKQTADFLGIRLFPIKSVVEVTTCDAKEVYIEFDNNNTVKCFCDLFFRLEWLG